MELNRLEELLLLISYKAENNELAENAFSTIYKEYSPFLTNLVKVKRKEMGFEDDEVLNATINNTFLKIYENPLKFTIPEGKEDDNCFKGWLTVVAKNELLTDVTQIYAHYL